VSTRLPALAGLLLGAGLGLVAGAQPWWRAVGEGVSVKFSGTDATAGLSQALAVVVLAGTLLALVLRARGRRVVGALLALAGAGGALLGALRPRPSAGAVRSQVREVSLADQFALDPTAWPWVFALSGVVVLGAATLMLATAGRWPVRTARFDRSPTAAAGRLPDLDDPAAVWRSLDSGVDPTVGPDEAAPGESAGAGVRE
jgi:uncharacterized membrane protein (TIGR02234 family)